MGVTTDWTSPAAGGVLDLATGGTVTEPVWDAVISDLLHLGGTAGYVPAAALVGVAMVKIAEVIPNDNVASIDIQNIPATYRTLLLDIKAASTDAAVVVELLMRLNNEVGAAYNTQYVGATGVTPSAASGIAATSASIGLIPGAGSPAVSSGQITLSMTGYADSGLKHSWVSMGGGGFYVRTCFGVFSYTDYINRITLTPSAGSLTFGSMAILYGA